MHCQVSGPSASNRSAQNDCVHGVDDRVLGADEMIIELQTVFFDQVRDPTGYCQRISPICRVLHAIDICL